MDPEGAGLNISSGAAGVTETLPRYGTETRTRHSLSRSLGKGKDESPFIETVLLANVI